MLWQVVLLLVKFCNKKRYAKHDGCRGRDTSCGIVLTPLSSIPRNSIRIYTHVVMNVIVVIYSIIAIPISFWKSTIVLAGRPLLAAAAACKVQHKARRSRRNERELLSVINVPPSMGKNCANFFLAVSRINDHTQF